MSTSFTDRVRQVVAAIPPGETRSYSAVAAAAGNPRAARAVARIMARNFDPAVPCHRVVRQDGTLGGYNRGGEVVKRCLLELEQSTK